MGGNDLDEGVSVLGFGRAVCFGEIVFVAAFVGFAWGVDVVVSGDGGEGVVFEEGVEFEASVLEFGMECGGGEIAREDDVIDVLCFEVVEEGGESEVLEFMAAEQQHIHATEQAFSLPQSSEGRGGRRDVDVG